MRKWSIRTVGRSLFLCLTAITFLFLGQTAACADEVTISGSATGNASGVPQLTFEGNANFTATTVLGVGALSGSNSLGTFFLSVSAAQMVSGSFTLNITFTVPVGIAGGQSSIFNATVAGIVSPFVGVEGVAIDFNNTPVLFTFNDGVNSGFFTLAIEDSFVMSGQSSLLRAGIIGSQAAIPEPATLFLLGTGLVSVAARVRRGRRGFREGPRRHPHPGATRRRAKDASPRA
jgi:hypothetical protein